MKRDKRNEKKIFAEEESGGKGKRQERKSVLKNSGARSEKRNLPLIEKIYLSDIKTRASNIKI